MHIIDPATGSAVINLQPKTIEQVLDEVDFAIFALATNHLPDVSLEDVLARMTEESARGPEHIRSLFTKLAGDASDWLPCALAAFTFVNEAQTEITNGRREAAWSHAATASAWVNYAYAIAILPSALTEEKKAVSKVAADTRWEGPREVKEYAIKLFVDRCPKDLWASFPAAAIEIFPDVEEFGKARNWGADKPIDRIATRLRKAPNRERYVRGRVPPA
jgi:hypothetical protein